MKRFLYILGLLLFHAASLYAQHSFHALVKDRATGEALPGVVAFIKDSHKNALTDDRGMAILRDLPAGATLIQFRSIGYKSCSLDVMLPDTSLHIIQMQPEDSGQEIVIVASTRSNDRIENATTKVEVLGPEEMREESQVKPGNVSSILGDVSGVQLQQSSVTTGNVNVRIQGLEGRYTQLLRDGMPVYEGFSGGFGVLSIPPLDLQQLEIVKGSSSTLYGGGAIAGLINFVSKKPSITPEATLVLNQTSLGESDMNLYTARRWRKLGLTLFAGQVFQKAVDVNKDGFSDLPRTSSTLIHPTLYYYPDSNGYISLGWSGSFDTRKGGDMAAIAGNTDPQHPFYESNLMGRHTFTLIALRYFNTAWSGTIKGSYSLFSRSEATDTNNFRGSQGDLYAEVSFVGRLHKHTLIGGSSLISDAFMPSSGTPVPVGSYTYTALGLFFQDTWQMTEKTKLEGGLRTDIHNKYGVFVLPRLALFSRLSSTWGMRYGIGTGYRAPDPLAPQLIDYDIHLIQPLAANITAERSAGANAELNYKRQWKDGSIFINQAFFLTSISSPIVATQDVSSGTVSFTNAGKPVLTRGSDTYAQIKWDDWGLYLGYTYTVAERKYLQRNQFMPLTPRNRASAVLTYEIEKRWRFGVEASYIGSQYRDDNGKTPSYALVALMASRELGKHFTIVLNCENLLDERQSRFESLYYGPIQRPQFRELWAPIDGRVINLSVRARL